MAGFPRSFTSPLPWAGSALAVAIGIECLMNWTDSCDDEVREPFFWSLNRERTKHENFENLAAASLKCVQLHQSIFEKFGTSDL
jgi:hypothetical protein